MGQGKGQGGETEGQGDKRGQPGIRGKPRCKRDKSRGLGGQG